MLHVLNSVYSELSSLYTVYMYQESEPHVDRVNGRIVLFDYALHSICGSDPWEKSLKRAALHVLKSVYSEFSSIIYSYTCTERVNLVCCNTSLSLLCSSGSQGVKPREK